MKINRFMGKDISLGKGSVKIPAAERIQDYRIRYNRLIARGLKFKYYLHYVLPGGRTIIHIKIPSETVDNFYYDVLLELNLSGGAKKFEDCHVRIFSNCPSFVYTYAYVFYHMPDDDLGKPTMMIDEFSQKIPKNRLTVAGVETKLGETPLTERPVIRNPFGLPLFDKSIYFALFFLIEKLDFNRVMYNKHISTIDSILNDITDFDTLMIQRKSLEQKARDRKKKGIKETKKTMQSTERDNDKKFGVNVKKVKGVNPIKHSPVAKHQPIKSIKSAGKK